MTAELHPSPSGRGVGGEGADGTARPHPTLRVDLSQRER